jgi:hypothetical protein
MLCVCVCVCVHTHAQACVHHFRDDNVNTTHTNEELKNTSQGN